MKHSIVFNHDATDVASSIGTSVDEVSTTMSRVIKKYMTDDDCIKRSHMCELVANEFSAEELVFLSCQQVFENMDELEADLKKLSALKSFLRED
jgi:hypothetical protein